MVAKKKANGSTSAEPPASMENAIVMTNNADNNEDTSVDHVTEGELEVELHDLGIPSDDIQDMRRIEACLTERSRNAR